MRRLIPAGLFLVASVAWGQPAVPFVPVTDQMLANPEKLYSQIRAVPHKDARGAVDGYRLSGIRRKSVFSQLGIKNGVRKINVDTDNRLAITGRGDGPLSGMLREMTTHTSDVEDVVVATKVRVLPEGKRRPALGIRFATRLPNASNSAKESSTGFSTKPKILSRKCSRLKWPKESHSGECGILPLGQKYGEMSARVYCTRLGRRLRTARCRGPRTRRDPICTQRGRFQEIQWAR